MNTLIQHEVFKEFSSQRDAQRDVEMDAMGIDAYKEKCYSDEDMWRDF